MNQEIALGIESVLAGIEVVDLRTVVKNTAVGVSGGTTYDVIGNGQQLVQDTSIPVIPIVKTGEFPSAITLDKYLSILDKELADIESQYSSFNPQALTPEKLAPFFAIYDHLMDQLGIHLDRLVSMVNPAHFKEYKVSRRIDAYNALKERMDLTVQSIENVLELIHAQKSTDGSFVADIVFENYDYDRSRHKKSLPGETVSPQVDAAGSLLAKVSELYESRMTSMVTDSPTDLANNAVAKASLKYLGEMTPMSGKEFDLADMLPGTRKMRFAYMEGGVLHFQADEPTAEEVASEYRLQKKLIEGTSSKFRLEEAWEMALAIAQYAARHRMNDLSVKAETLADVAFDKYGLVLAKQSGVVKPFDSNVNHNPPIDPNTAVPHYTITVQEGDELRAVITYAVLKSEKGLTMIPFASSKHHPKLAMNVLASKIAEQYNNSPSDVFFASPVKDHFQNMGYEKKGDALHFYKLIKVTQLH